MQSFKCSSNQFSPGIGYYMKESPSMACNKCEAVAIAMKQKQNHHPAALPVDGWQDPQLTSTHLVLGLETIHAPAHMFPIP